MIRKILLFLLIVFIAIQFFRPEKNVSTSISENDITRVYPVPENVQQILSRSCNDCHSNNTQYPWYAEIQPVAWYLADHIKDGKDELNFSEFGSYRIARQNKKMKECIKELKEGEMPLKSYTLIHTSSKISETDKQAIISWCESIQQILQQKYPADSLELKKPK
ncbi:MAG: heme-binding domain-containing protein [Bacteroidetes bacterium]|nr:heme-binding domain-containing protein [Bacteroidota bacterium]